MNQSHKERLLIETAKLRVYINKNLGLYTYIEVIAMMKSMDPKGVACSSHKTEDLPVLYWTKNL